jgi:hypothetical protein
MPRCYRSGKRQSIGGRPHRFRIWLIREKGLVPKKPRADNGDGCADSIT